jgi:hypothetical protein
MKKIVLLCSIFLMLMIPSVFAQGTLVGAMDIDVTSNRESISGRYILATWAVTPSRSDAFVVYDSNTLPDGYSLDESFRVDFDQTRFEQVFALTEQRREDLFIPTPIQSKYFFMNPLDGVDSNTECRQKLQEWVNDQGKTLFPNVRQNYRAKTLGCDVDFFLVESNQGWYAPVVDFETYYQQKIDFGDKGSITLQRNEKVDEPTGRIDGVASATLTQFGSWNQARLNDKDIHAYHLLNQDKWSVYQDSQGIATYRAIVGKMDSLLSRDYYSYGSNDANQLVTEIKQEVNRIQAISQTKPINWADKAGTIRYAGNQAIVQLTYPTGVTNVQLLLSGDAFGLYRSVGEARINTVGQCSFSETDFGYVDFSVTNVANGKDSFTFSLTCDNDIAGSSFSQEIDAKDTLKSKIRLSGKTSSNQDETSSCVFTAQNSEGEKKTERISCQLEAKKSCVTGQESIPYTLNDGQSYIVDIFDDSCNVIDTKSCDKPKQFVKDKGFYVCKEVTILGGGGDSNTGNINTPLLIVSVLLGIIATAIVIPNTSFMKLLKVGDVELGSIIRWVIIPLVFIVVTIVSAYVGGLIIAGFVKLFSIPFI